MAISIDRADRPQPRRRAPRGIDTLAGPALVELDFPESVQRAFDGPDTPPPPPLALWEVAVLGAVMLALGLVALCALTLALAEYTDPAPVAALATEGPVNP